MISIIRCQGEIMSDSIYQIVVYLVAGSGVGLIIGWLVKGVNSRQKFDRLRDDLQLKFDEAARQRDKFNTDNIKLRSSIEAMQAAAHKHEVAATRSQTELESTREKLKLVAKDLMALTARRDQLESEVNDDRNALASVKRQLNELEIEFEKAGTFYKGELSKAFEKRKTVETRLDDAKAEHESLTNLLDASRFEKDSVNKMLTSAQTRLDNLDELEQSAIELEAVNAELRHEASRTKQEVEGLRRDAAEMDELKVQNRELAHCLKSMENSRQQYEIDAKRYRNQAEQSENLSDTLRIKLDDVEKNLGELARQNDDIASRAREKEQLEETGGQREKEVDDLTKIVGIGKVFQHALHSLGVYSFRQIANFGPADIARVNMALKENKGRMEQDDWVGQAKELYFHKHSEMVEH